MQILVDSYSEPNDVTQNIVKEIIKNSDEIKGFTTKVSSGLGKKSTFNSDALDRWDVKTHKYGTDVAAKIGFLANLFSGSSKKVSAGVVHEAKRFCVRKMKDGRVGQIGVAVRLSVALSRLDIEAELSIPNLAAASQLGQSDTKVGISVEGYYGPIGDLLPTPEDLNVQNFAKFTGAAEKIQQRVFGPGGMDYFSPTLLSYSDAKA